MANMSLDNQRSHISRPQVELSFGSRTLGPSTVGAPEYIGDGAYRISYVATMVSERQHTCSALYLRDCPGESFSGVDVGAYSKSIYRDNMADWGARMAWCSMPINRFGLVDIVTNARRGEH